MHHMYGVGSEAIRIEPNVALAYASRGWTLNRAGKYDKAITDYTEAIRIKPDYADAYYSRGIAYREKGDNAKAAADFAEAKRLGYKPPSRASDGP